MGTMRKGLFKRWTPRYLSFVLALLVSLLFTAFSPALAEGPSIANLLAPDLHLGGYYIEPQHFSSVEEMGINTVAMVPMSVREYQPYLEQAKQNGLKVRISISPSFVNEPDSVVTNYVATLAQSDAVAMWYLPEEPKTEAQHQAMRRLYSLIKKADPKRRPIGVYLAEDVTPEYFRFWSDIADVIFCGAYPELYGIERVSMVTRIKGALEGTAGTGTAIIATPQFFDAQTYMARNGLSTLPPGFHFGYPSYQHMRFDAYIPLMLGAQGLDWYTFEYGLYVPDMVDSMRRVLAELNELEPILTSSDPIDAGISTQILAGPTMSKPGKGVQHPSIFVTARKYRGNTYLFAASLVADPVSVQFQGLRASQVEVLFEDRTIPVSEGTMTDEFTDYAVHVYKLVGPKLPGLKVLAN